MTFIVFVIKTGDDTATLRKVEELIQKQFKNGHPPHLQLDAKSKVYVPESDQSRIFVSSHSDFSLMDDTEIQRILRNRLILVHDNPIDFEYEWDLKSFARLYDVDDRISVQGESRIPSSKLILAKIVLVSTLKHPLEPDFCHRHGTLREFLRLTDTLSNVCPPMNAISLPARRRNLNLPCQFGSLASHEVAQSRLPREYEETFQVPDVRSSMEWSLIGGKGAISPFHLDSEGLGTVVMVLEGRKYWIVATRLGGSDTICSFDSLGPNWSPYFLTEGNYTQNFRFEAVHLKKGDMLYVPFSIS